MLAKICSDINKPDGQYVLSSDPAELAAFVAGLSIRKVPGIGRVRPALQSLICTLRPGCRVLTSITCRPALPGCMPWARLQRSAAPAAAIKLLWLLLRGDTAPPRRARLSCCCLTLPGML